MGIFEGDRNLGFAKNYESSVVKCPLCSESHKINVYDKILYCSFYKSWLDKMIQIWFPFNLKIYSEILASRDESLSFIKGIITEKFWNTLKGPTQCRYKFISLKMKEMIKIIENLINSFSNNNSSSNLKKFNWDLTFDEIQKHKKIKANLIRKLNRESKKRKRLSDIEHRKKKWMRKENKYTPRKRIII